MNTLIQTLFENHYICEFIRQGKIVVPYVESLLSEFKETPVTADSPPEKIADEIGILSFQKGNAKLGKDIYTFSLPAGWTCPGAKLCKAYYPKEGNGGIQTGKHAEYRCFSASMEWLDNVRKLRWSNYDMLRGKTEAQMTDLLAKSIEHAVKPGSTVRLHISGDFFNAGYFRAWCKAATMFPDRLFYTYTKSVPFLVQNKGLIPKNLVLTASKDGRYDDLIDKNHLKFGVVVFSKEEADNYIWIDAKGKKHKGLEIDHDDSHAMKNDGIPFALLLHGIQPAGTEASAALRALGGRSGESSYSKRKKALHSKELGENNMADSRLLTIIREEIENFLKEKQECQCGENCACSENHTPMDTSSGSQYAELRKKGMSDREARDVVLGQDKNITNATVPYKGQTITLQYTGFGPTDKWQWRVEDGEPNNGKRYPDKNAALAAAKAYIDDMGDEESPNANFDDAEVLSKGGPEAKHVYENAGVEEENAWRDLFHNNNGKIKGTSIFLLLQKNPKLRASFSSLSKPTQPGGAYIKKEGDWFVWPEMQQLKEQEVHNQFYKTLADMIIKKYGRDAFHVETQKEWVHIILDVLKDFYASQGYSNDVISKKLRHDAQDEDFLSDMYDEMNDRRLEEAALPEATIFTSETMDAEAKKIETGIKAPFVKVSQSTLGGKERPSLLLAISLDEKTDWSYGIFENSAYMRFHLLYDGTLEQFTRSSIPNKFKKMRVKSVDEAIAKINAYIEKVSKQRAVPVQEITVGESKSVKNLSVPEKHQLKIALKTLKMPDAAIGVMGGPNKEEAIEIIKKLTGKLPALKESSMGRLDKDTSDALEGIVLSNKTQNDEQILQMARHQMPEELSIVDDEELMSYIKDIRQIYSWMK